MNNYFAINRFYSRPKIDLDETILETLSMLEKDLKILLNIVNNGNAARLAEVSCQF